MTQGNYHTAFQMGFRSFPWSAVAHPLIFVAIGLLLVRFLKDRKPYLVIGIFMASLASLFVLLSLMNFIPKFLKLRSAHVSGKGSTVEGLSRIFTRLRYQVPQENPFRCEESGSRTTRSTKLHVFTMLLSTVVRFETAWTFGFITMRGAFSGSTS